MDKTSYQQTSHKLLIEPMLPALSKPCHISLASHTNGLGKEYISLYELAQSDPKKALQQIGPFTDTPHGSNLHAFLLIKAHKAKEANKVIIKTYQKWPNYLFAKINYADYCLRKKNWDEISRIFSSFDFSELYPDKTTFHFSEFRGFMTVMGFYHLAMKDRKAAAVYYTLAVKADPLHTSVAALEKKLFRFSWLRGRLAPLWRTG